MQVLQEAQEAVSHADADERTAPLPTHRDDEYGEDVRDASPYFRRSRQQVGGWPGCAPCHPAASLTLLVQRASPARQGPGERRGGGLLGAAEASACSRRRGPSARCSHPARAGDMSPARG